MSTLNKYSLKGEKLGEVEVSEKLANSEANSQSIKDYIVALRENKRQWSASTKGRSEVKHTTAKPRPQKGSGNARQGSLVAPQFRGGGVVFGPKPKFDQHVRINKKERKAAIRCLLAEKIKNGRAHILDSSAMEAPQTKVLSNFLNKCSFGKRVLFLGDSEHVEIKTEDVQSKFNVKCTKHQNLQKSLRNIPKMEFSLAQNINGYEVMLANDIVMTAEALNELESWLC